jgi:hypothetical protein
VEHEITLGQNEFACILSPPRGCLRASVIKDFYSSDRVHGKAVGTVCTTSNVCPKLSHERPRPREDANGGKAPSLAESKRVRGNVKPTHFSRTHSGASPGGTAIIRALCVVVRV